MSQTAETKPMGITRSNHENRTASAIRRATPEMRGKTPRAYHCSTAGVGYRSAQEVRKVTRAKAGRIHPKRAPADRVDSPETPTLRLTIAMTLCYIRALVWPFVAIKSLLFKQIAE